MDDAQLLRRYAEEGSQAAFSELVGRYLNLVHSAAMRQVGGDFHLAKDVAQLVFADLARKAQALSRHPALIGWLYTSTSFAASKLMRAERRRLAREEGAYIMSSELSSNPAAELDWDQLRPALDGVMLELNEHDRAAILWRFFDGQPLAAIGAKLGVNEDTARKRVDRALDKMHGAFTKRGVESTTAALSLMLANQAVVAAPAGLAESVTAAALSSAAEAGSSSFALGKIMGVAKSGLGGPAILWIGGILGALGLGVAVYELRTMWRAETSLAAATQEYESQMDRFRSLERSVREASQNKANRATSAEALPKGLNPFVAGRKFLARFPQARTLLADEGMLEAATINAPFFRLEGLAPAQIEQFEALIAATWVANVIVTPTDAQAGVSSPAEDKISQLLGEQVAQQYENYLQIQYAYQFTGFVAASLSAAGMPPSPDQIDQMAQIVETNSSFYKNNAAMDKNAVSFGDFAASVDWDGVVTQAKAALSPAQWEVARGPLLNAQVRGAFFQAQHRSSP